MKNKNGLPYIDPKDIPKAPPMKPPKDANVNELGEHTTFNINNLHLEVNLSKGDWWYTKIFGKPSQKTMEKLYLPIIKGAFKYIIDNLSKQEMMIINEYYKNLENK